MRELLFRGKRIDNGEWVYGDFIHRKIWYSKVAVIRRDDSGFDNYSEFEVDPETVGQYTGLTDKNGTKIFEGDIVCFAYDSVGKITWEDTEAKFAVRWDNYVRDFDSFYGKELTVIGNIHDNPESLEV